MNKIRATVFLLLTMVSTGALATTVYRSVDANGVVHFSDRPPREDASSVEILRLAVPAPVSVPDSRQLLADMAATTERLREDRLRRSEERAPKPSQALPATAQHYSQPAPAWYYPGPYRHGYHGGHPWNHHPHRDHQKREPDPRTERDRRRDDMRGTWVIPRQLPRSVRPPSDR